MLDWRMIFATFNNITNDEIIHVSVNQFSDILREYMNRCPGYNKFSVTIYDDAKCINIGEGEVFSTSSEYRLYDAILHYRDPSSTITTGRFICPRKTFEGNIEI